MTELPAWHTQSEHDKLLDHARETFMDRQKRGESLDAESIIAQMVEELDEGEDMKPHPWLVEAVTKAVTEFLAP